MAIEPADNPQAWEDSVTRIATPEQEDNRAIVGRFDKRTYVLIDGPNAGETVEFWVAYQEVDAVVSGTVAATQSGSWSVSVTGEVEIKNDSGNPIPVSGTVAVSNFPATQPVSAASLPLPSGASTAAKQPALGTAGTASADVITIQGIASMTAVKVDGSAVAQPVTDNGGSLTVDGTVTAAQPAASTGTKSSPSITSSAGTVLAANSSRLGATVWNEGSATLYLSLGGSPSTTSYTAQVIAGGYYEVPFGYTGNVCGVTSTGTAQLRVTEITA